MEPITNKLRIPQKAPSKRGNERSDLIQYFAQRMGWKYPRAAKTLQHVTDLADLYFLQKECENAEKKGIAFGAAFWTRIKVKELSTNNPPSQNLNH
jgi:hypothetical protein